jgi:glycine/D-amino acid oxidase-like deaminating enzyme
VARAAAIRGARIHEHTAVDVLEPGIVRTRTGSVRAEIVVRATEGYTGQFAGERRSLLPIYSLMIATEPLTPEMWKAIGLANRPTFHDGRRLIIYGQRTTDGRIAFGGRGAPYHFGSNVQPAFDTHDGVRRLLADSLRDLFPVLADAELTHHWGGVLGAARDWTSFVRFDRSSGFATAGGYVGDGLASTHLAGCTLAALITASLAPVGARAAAVGRGQRHAAGRGSRRRGRAPPRPAESPVGRGAGPRPRSLGKGGRPARSVNPRGEQLVEVSAADGLHG